MKIAKKLKNLKKKRKSIFEFEMDQLKLQQAFGNQ